MAPGGHEPGHSVPLQQSGIGPADTVARDQFPDTDLSCPIQAKPCQDSHKDKHLADLVSL